MKKQLSLSFLFLVVGFICASPASAQRALGSGAGAFGAPGEFVITGDFEGHLHNGWELRLHPSLDYFIAPHVSVGGLFGITYDSGNPSQTTIDLGVRAGFTLNINEAVTFWPMAGVTFHHFATGSTAAASGTSGSRESLDIFAPFLYHLVPHLFVGAGPLFNLSLNGDGNGYGIQTVVGGWF
jgi:hypothetical protein